MAVILKQWLDLIDEEYLRGFVVKGGAAVKFLVADEAGIGRSQSALGNLAANHGLCCARVTGAVTKLHMMHELFFAVSRQVNWETDAQCVVEALFKHNGYEWPKPGEAMPLKEIAEANQTDATILDRDFKKWLTSELMKDTSMAQDFRLAVTQLCVSSLLIKSRKWGLLARFSSGFMQLARVQE